MDLHEAADHIAKSQQLIAAKAHSTHIEGLHIAVVGEHYLAYVPAKNKHIIITALLRQTQDAPSIIEVNSFTIRLSVKEAIEASNEGKV